ncbi:MAG TPA: D-aminoacylase [Candidatus Eremiobacteraceae bacterium]|jgi:N-acyl-D-amino-acid deacylase
MLDVVLEQPTIVDGTGNLSFRTDVALRGDRIVRIGDCADRDAIRRIDCSALVVAPGFIDMHGHSDEALLALPTADSKILQGVTLEVGGNCGASPGPFSAASLAERRDELRSRYDLDTTWNDFAGFLDALDAAPSSINFCCLVGLGETRKAIGAVTPGPLAKESLERQCALVRDACERGAIGVSSGLIYQPGSFADLAELESLAGAARDAGSPLYASHIRSEGDLLVEAVEEALTIGRRAGIAVQLSHHKAAGRRNWGKVHDTLALIERARTSGVDVVLDQYPYKASSTGLDVMLPADVNVGTKAEIAARLADPAYFALTAGRIDLEYAGRWDEVLVASVGSERHRDFEGMTVAAIADRTGAAPAAAALGLLRDESLDVAAIYFTMCEDDLRAVLQYANTCIGSDSSARATEGVTARGKPHPRTFGTFPRIFKRYVRESKLLSLEEAVRRATGLAAERLGIRERGRIAEGCFADLVLFDPLTIADTSTYEEPHHYPAGIRSVYVNGEAVVHAGKITGARPGRLLRRGRDL